MVTMTTGTVATPREHYICRMTNAQVVPRYSKLFVIETDSYCNCMLLTRNTGMPLTHGHSLISIKDYAGFIDLVIDYSLLFAISTK